MANILYITYFTIVIAFALFGAYIYVYRKDKINITQVVRLFYISLILRVFDTASTILFTSILGIQYEGNLIVRTLMYQFGIFGGLAVSILILVPTMFFIYVATNSMVKDYGWKMFCVIIIISGLLIPIYNLIGLTIVMMS